MSSSPVSSPSLASLGLFEQMQRRGDLAAPTIPIDLDDTDTQLQESAESTSALYKQGAPLPYAQLIQQAGKDAS